MSAQSPITVSDSESSSPTIVSAPLPEVDELPPYSGALRGNTLRDYIDFWIESDFPDMTPFQIRTFVHNVGMVFRHVLNICELDEGVIDELNEVSILIVNGGPQLILYSCVRIRRMHD